MGQTWAQNFAQFPVSEFVGHFDHKQMADIPYPFAELTIHATFKTVEAGSLIGGWILPAIIHNFNPATTTLKDKIKLYGRYGVLIGLAAGPILTLARIKLAHINKEAAYERCYRLRYNKRQLFIDRFSCVAAAFGFYGARWFGLINSVNGCIIAAAVYNKFLWDLLPRRFHDVCEEPPLNKPPPRKL